MGFFGDRGRDQPSKEKAARMAQSWRPGAGMAGRDNQENREPAGQDNVSASPADRTTRGVSTGLRAPLSNITNQAVGNIVHPGIQAAGVGGGSFRRTSFASAQIPETVPETSPAVLTHPLVDEEGYKTIQRHHNRARTGASSNIGDIARTSQGNQHSHIPATLTNGSTRRSSYGRGPRNVSGFLHSEQKPGVVVRHYDYRRSTDPNAKLGDKGTIRGPDDKPWVKKLRTFDIVANYGDKVLEVPNYSFDDKGLANKPDDIHWQYMSVKPLGVPTEGFVNQSSKNPILNIGKDDRKQLSRPTLVAHFLDTRLRDIDCPELQIVGALDQKSTELLIEYASEAMKGKLPRKS